nr:hypothetical protein [Pseudanabaena cinerea]
MVISAEDWEQQQETLFVLQNSNPMQQIYKPKDLPKECPYSIDPIFDENFPIGIQNDAH